MIAKRASKGVTSSAACFAHDRGIGYNVLTTITHKYLLSLPYFKTLVANKHRCSMHQRWVLYFRRVFVVCTHLINPNQPLWPFNRRIRIGGYIVSLPFSEGDIPETRVLECVAFLNVSRYTSANETRTWTRGNPSRSWCRFFRVGALSDVHVR